MGSDARISIRGAGLEEADTVMQMMRAAFEEYRGKLYPESGALAKRSTTFARASRAAAHSSPSWRT